jgi:hypothetical protein
MFQNSGQEVGDIGIGIGIGIGVHMAAAESTNETPASAGK